MNKDFLIVSRKILPDYLEKVIQARNLLENHEAATITEAVKIAGISRNTYYKYKDYVFAAGSAQSERHAVISLILKDKPGVLSGVMNQLSLLETSILTISQAIPIAGKANVLISLDISKMKCTSEELLDNLKQVQGVKKVHLDGIE